MDLLLYCRAGFEPECAAEVAECATLAGLAGFPQTERGSGWVRYRAPDQDAPSSPGPLAWRNMIFARQKLDLLAELPDLPPSDRIAPMLEALQAHGASFGDLVMEHPDTDTGKPLSGLARSLGNALRPALRKAGGSAHA